MSDKEEFSSYMSRFKGTQYKDSVQFLPILRTIRQINENGYIAYFL